MSLELLGAFGAAGAAIYFFRFAIRHDDYLRESGVVGGVSAAFTAIFVCLIPALALLSSWRKKWWLQVLPALAMLIALIGLVK